MSNRIQGQLTFVYLILLLHILVLPRNLSSRRLRVYKLKKKKHQTGKKSSSQFRMRTKHYNLRTFTSILRAFKLPNFSGKSKEQYPTIMFLFCSVSCTDLRDMRELVRRNIKNTDAFKQELRIRCTF